MTRYREISTPENGGRINSVGCFSSKPLTQVLNFTEQVWDETVPIGIDNQVFNSLKYSYEGGRYVRPCTSGTNPSADKYLCDWFRTFSNVRGRHAATDCPSLDVLSSKALMGASPNRASVDVPTAIFELRELPQLLRSVPRNIKAVADINLKYQFGIKPMVRDVIALLGIVKEMRHRIRNLQHLYNGGAGRKTVNLGNYSGEVTEPNVALQSIGGLIVRDVKFRSQLSVKGHVRYHADKAFTSLPESKAVRAVIDTTLGNTLDLVTLWNAMPWSWLADWVSNSEEIVHRHRNIVPTIIDSVRIMKTHHTQVTADGYIWSFGSLSPYKGKCEAKWREIGNIKPSFSLDTTWFTPRQIGILGSIAALRWRRS